MEKRALRILIALFIWVVSTTLIYFCFSFVSLEIDFRQWSEFARVLFIWATLSATFFIGVYAFAN